MSAHEQVTAYDKWREKELAAGRPVPPRWSASEIHRGLKRTGAQFPILLALDLMGKVQAVVLIITIVLAIALWVAGWQPFAWMMTGAALLTTLCLVTQLAVLIHLERRMIRTLHQ